MTPLTEREGSGREKQKEREACVCAGLIEHGQMMPCDRLRQPGRAGRADQAGGWSGKRVGSRGGMTKTKACATTEDI